MSAEPYLLGKYVTTVRAEEVRALVGEGVTIGSHSLRHDDFRELGDEAVVADARQSRARLEAVVGAPVASFAFPWGHHRRHHKALVGDIYARVFLTEHGFCTADDRFLPRNEVDSLPHLAAAASGSLDLKNLFGSRGEIAAAGVKRR